MSPTIAERAAALRTLGDAAHCGMLHELMGPTAPLLPVGFVFTSTSPTNPAELLGYGTWLAMEKTGLSKWIHVFERTA